MRPRAHTRGADCVARTPRVSLQRRTHLRTATPSSVHSRIWMLTAHARENTFAASLNTQASEDAYEEERQVSAAHTCRAYAARIVAQARSPTRTSSHALEARRPRTSGRAQGQTQAQTRRAGLKARGNSSTRARPAAVLKFFAFKTRRFVLNISGAVTSLDCRRKQPSRTRIAPGSSAPPSYRKFLRRRL
jgi:hypothetical protein